MKTYQENGFVETTEIIDWSKRLAQYNAAHTT